MKRWRFARPFAAVVVLALLASPIAAFAVPSHAGAVSGLRAGHSPATLTPWTLVHPNPAGGHSYAVTFSESGLPGGLTWGVNLGHSSSSTTTDGSTDTVGFFVVNGTYAYSIPDISGWHQSTLPYHGSVVVSGAAISEPTLVYSQVTYTVTFSESGLPSGQTFQVTLNGSVRSLVTDGATDTLTFTQPNGSLAYTILDVSGWHQTTLAYHGHATVNGATLAEPTLAYTQVTYTVSFSESGLPSGKTFQVSLGGVPKSLTTNGALDTLSWSGLANNSYPYTVGDVAGWHQTTLPYHGTVVVNGAPIAEPPMVFSKALYSVVFSESGLPAGILFQVTVGSSHESLVADGLTDSLLFTQTNGTYSYSVTGISGWYQATLPYNGHVTVNGTAVFEPTLVFGQVTYSVRFTESGLPLNTTWGVTLNGSTLTTNTTSLVFIEPNGTYPYKIDYVAGYMATPTTGFVTVNGGPLSTGVPFTQVLYAVSFNELHLPGGTSWGVTINAHSVTSTGPTVSFNLPNGSYGYRINYVSGWVPSFPTGTVDVTGAPVATPVSFSLVTYAITFSETGLPASVHKAWSVALDGTQLSSTGTSIVFHVGNGTHVYLIKGPAGFRVSSVLSPAGSIPVSGGDVPVAVLFLRGPTPSVGFHELGLAVGTRWCVVFGESICTTSNRIVSKNLTPGTYPYAIQSVPGMTTLVKFAGASIAPSGSVGISAGRTFQIRFSWPVTFSETGLSFATAWQVSAGGTKVPSTGTSIVFYLINGTYSFHIPKVTGYLASPASGGFRVNGAPITILIRFTPHV